MMVIPLYTEIIKSVSDIVNINDDITVTRFVNTPTTNLNIRINGNLVEVNNCNIKKVLGDVNASSTFKASINNYTGRSTGSYSIGDEVKIFVDKFNPPQTQIFLGILEDINLDGKEETERLTLMGRDYSARLMDRTVEPEVYSNIPAGSIVNDIITKYTDDITTTNVVSGLNVERLSFNQLPVFDAIRELAQLNNFMFYVDNDKDLHFKEKASKQSGFTFGSGGTPIINSSFKDKRNTVYNEVWVYGDRYLDGFTETFTGVAGSNYILGYKPHNTIVVNSGTVPEIIQPGGIFQMTFSAGSQFKYLVNFDDKRIIFTSGTLAGDNRYIGSDLIINYMRDLPIVKFGDNDSSIDRYGKRVKVIQDKSIKDPLTAESILLTELEEFSDPQKEGKIKVSSIANVNVGDTCVVNIPYYNINNVTYDIIEANYDITKRNLLADEILSIKVNKKIPDITDTLKSILLEQKRLASQDFQDTDLLTRYKFSPGSIGIRTSGIEVSTRTLGSSFILGNNVTGSRIGDEIIRLGILGSKTGSISYLGDSRSALIIQFSGGYF